MADHKYTQMQSKRRKEIERDGNTYIRFLGVLRYSEPNPCYIEKPAGKDTRTANQKRKTVWREITKTLEAEKVTKGRKSMAKKQEETEANIRMALEAWREEVESEEGTYQSEAARRIVTEYISAYIDLRERVQINGMKKLEASTALDYRKVCKRLEDGFSNVSVGEVTTKYVRDWERKQLEKGTSANQVRKCHRLLHLVFQNAYEEEEIPTNPVSRVHPPSAEKKEPNSLTQEGMQLVTAKLEESAPTPVVTAAYIALHAGLRCGECCALTWGDVNFEEETLTVRGSIGVASGGSYAKSTKTGKVRVVDFDTEHMGALLKARRSAMMAERDNISEAFDALYVCGSSDGAFSHPTRISREWNTLSQSWGLVGTTGERINFHALRHSFVTAQLSSGASVRDVADNAGHASTQMTVDTYASALRKGKKDAARKSGDYMRLREEAEVLDFKKTGTGD